MGDPISTPRGLRWLTELTFDQNFGALTVRVGVALYCLAQEDGVDRVCISRAALAQFTGVSARSVQRAPGQMRARGYIGGDRGPQIGRKRDGTPVYGGRSLPTIELLFRG